MNKSLILKIIIGCLLISLFLIIFRISNSFTVLRWGVLLASTTLAFECFVSKRYNWAIAFVLFLLLFNPWIRPSLSRTQWIIADILLFLSLVFWSLDYFRNYHKGLLFERFIQNKFPDQKYVLVNATKDLHKKISRFVESDTNPDFIFRERATGKTFAVECKYRSSCVVGNLGDEGIWWKKEQGNRYLNYSKSNNIPVYISIGVGGNPRSPKVVALIPIEIIQEKYFNFIPKKIIEKYLLL